AAFDVARQRHARGLDLPVGDPAGLRGLQSVMAERNLGPTGRQTLGASLEHLPELYSLRTEHARNSLCVCGLGPVARGLRSDASAVCLPTTIFDDLTLEHPHLHADRAE